jgi:hypothetical protein
VLFYWPEDHQERQQEQQHHHHNGVDQEEIETTLKVMEIIKTAISSETTRARVSMRHPGFGLTSFMRAIELNKYIRNSRSYAPAFFLSFPLSI